MICRLKTNLADDDLSSGTVRAVKMGERNHYGTGADWLNYFNNGA